MKVLWIVNSILPEVQSSLSGESASIAGTGSWLQAGAEMLSEIGSIELCIAAISSRVKQLYRFKGKKISYYLIPTGRGNIRINPEYNRYWELINGEFKPDLIHIHGSELPHGLGVLETLPQVVSVVSIQGLMSEIWPHYCDGMSICDKLRSITIRDIVLDIVRPRELCGTLFSREKNFRIKGSVEPLIYNKVKNVIGRTSWDKARVLSMNPDLNYYECNETLRSPFYEGKWSYRKCSPHTIFLSQCIYPFKGLHMVLKALPMVLTVFPDARVSVAGKNPFGDGSFKSLVARDGYAAFIGRLIKSLGLPRDIVSFTGPLDADGMKRQYLACNVFISASAIENSPNSLGEAQMLGVPCIATDAGGTRDFIPDDSYGHLYDFEDVDKLASLIIDVFESSPSFDGSLEQGLAHERHNAVGNTARLLEIYAELTSSIR